MSDIQPTRWVVIPDGIEETRFADPESFYLWIQRSTRDGEHLYVVSAGHDQQGFTRHGKLVYLRHDVNAKHAFHKTFGDACDLARLIANGLLVTEFYRPWRRAQEQRWPTGEGA